MSAPQRDAGALLGVGGLAEVTTALAPIQLRNAAEQIADRLVTAIALGEFVPDQRLPTERELSTMLGVNRTAVREALHTLVGAGYVEIRRGRTGGAYVQRAWGPGSPAMIRRTLLPNWQDLEALFDVRRLLESLIAHTAALRGTPEDRTGIAHARDVYAAAEDDREASRAADHALHGAIAGATRNPYLVRLSQQIRAQVSLGFQAEPFSADLRARAIEQHATLVEAVLAGAASQAGELAAEHFSLTEGALRRLRDRVEAGEA